MQCELDEFMEPRSCLEEVMILQEYIENTTRACQVVAAFYLPVLDKLAW